MCVSFNIKSKPKIFFFCIVKKISSKICHMPKGNHCGNVNSFLLPSLIILKDKVKVRHF